MEYSSVLPYGGVRGDGKPSDSKTNPTEDIRISSGSNSEYLREYVSDRKFLQGRVVPPDIIKEKLNNLSVNRQFAKLVADSQGGTYKLFDITNSMTVSLPSRSVKSPTTFIFIESTNKNDYPFIPGYSMRSNVYHCSPNGFTFEKDIIIGFPYQSKTDESSKVCLMYHEKPDFSHSPPWRIIKKEKQSSNDPSYFIAGDICFVKARHFCSFVIVSGPAGIEQECQKVRAYLNAKYNSATRVLQVDVGLEALCHERVSISFYYNLLCTIFLIF